MRSSIIAIVLSLAGISSVAVAGSVYAGIPTELELPPTGIYDRAPAAPSAAAVGTVKVVHALRKDKKGKWVIAADASITITSARTGAVITTGRTDGNGNWSGTVPAWNTYVLTASFDGGRVTDTVQFIIPKNGGTKNLSLHLD